MNLKITTTICLLSMSKFSGACPVTLDKSTLLINKTVLNIEIAQTKHERQCGLSQRDKLPANQGMLFVFNKSKILSFWMRNTYIPLTIAFLDNNGTVIDLLDMRPNQTLELYNSSAPAKYALETNKGWFKQQKVNIGDKISLNF